MTKSSKFNPRAWVSPEAFNVKPDLLGLPLATAGRRALAITLDICVIGLLSSLAWLWLLAAIAAVLHQLRKSSADVSYKQRRWLWLALLLLSIVASIQMVRKLDDQTQSKSVNAVRALDDDVDEQVAKAKLLIASATSSANVATNAANNTATDTANESEQESLPEETDAARIATLEQELALARLPSTLKWREQVMKSLSSMGLHFGWAIVYFSLLPYWWNGQSLGKRVFGLRVLELTGKPMRPLLNLSRYGGYAAGMATGGIGFLQVLWDMNRQAIQDKIAHTVVVDLRQPRRLDLLEAHLNQPTSSEQTQDGTAV
ncbi:RDD family protein [Undibacterium parvum]|uniref:RDD family protein n=1 Tax=Undibacterium parvum TaxID=401471 RepID=A0A3S9HPU7_9BURK|nr:RDD family protein [Undibacterium parvum]AZP14130.1 RDD family protein [Undibacterium parvum]